MEYLEGLQLKKLYERRLEQTIKNLKKRKKMKSKEVSKSPMILQS
jgi:hypothetical protein